MVDSFHGMKRDQKKSEAKPGARSKKLTVAQQYQELVKLRREVLSLQKKSKHAKAH
jgi:hypothetical protein